MFNWNTSRWPKNDELLAGQCAALCVWGGMRILSEQTHLAFEIS
jgi:hypothetical protein